jgi:hypothetical protein
MKIQGNLEQGTLKPFMQWKLLPLFKSTYSLSILLLDYINLAQTKTLVLKGQVVAYPPPQHMHQCTRTCEV